MFNFLWTPFRGLCLLLISASVLSCQKETNDQDSPGTGSPPDYLITEMDNNYGRYKLFYNDKDQLIKVEYLDKTGYSPEPTPYQNVEYKYENGKVISFSQRFYNNSTNTWSGEEICQLTYDQSGNVIKVTRAVNTSTYEYDARGRPTRIMSTNTNPKELMYDDDGNVMYPLLPSDNPAYPYLRWSEMKYTSYKNQLLRNGTSLLLLFAFQTMAGRPTEIFSAHLPEKYETYAVTIQPTGPSGENRDFKGSNFSQYSYSFDKDGILKSIIEKYKNQTFYGGKLETEISDEQTFEITAIKR